MGDVSFKICNKPIKEDILDWEDIEIEVSFEDAEPKTQVSTGNLEFVGEAFTLIDKWFKNGLLGKDGVFEAPPFAMDACGLTVLDGGVNIADCGALFECDKITAPIREANKMDFLNERARGFSFAYLADPSYNGPGKITQADYVQVPYVINSIPNYEQALLGCVSMYILIRELRDAIRQTAHVIADLSGDATTTAGSVVNPVIAAAMAVGMVIQDIIKIALYIAYIVVIVVALIDLMILFFQSLIQPLKYKKGIKVSTLFTRACQYLGINFASTILQTAPYSNLCIIPKKTALIGNKKTTFFTSIVNLTLKQYDDATHPNTYGYFEGTFADLILGMNNVLNAKPTIIVYPNGNTILHYERVDYFKNQAQYTLPPIDFRPNGTNACELAANYYLTFSLDDSDTNTYDLYGGTSCQHIQEVSSVTNKGNILLSNLDERRLIFARAQRKTSFTAIEDIFSAVYNIVAAIYNTITGFFNAIITVINKLIKAIANLFGFNPPQIPTFLPFPPNPMFLRLNAMLLSSDFIGVPKLAVVSLTGHLDPNNDTYTAAWYLTDKFHYVNFAYTTKDSQGNARTEHNQYLTYQNKDIPLCCADFLKIKNNNFIKTADNKIAKVDKLFFKPKKQTARISYRVKELYTKNLKETYIIDGN